MKSIENIKFPDRFVYLPILALCVDLFTPYLIWKNVIPAEIRWISHIVIAFMIIITIFRMIAYDHIPRIVVYIFSILIIGTMMAVRYGQATLPTIWGIWLVLQFPMVALFAYLQPNPPKNLQDVIRKFGLRILILQVLVQIIQYALGEPPGDDLAGLFGNNGTGIAVVFALMINCFFLGYWISTRRWLELVIVMVLGGVSSVLGEMKLYPYGIAIVGIIALVIYSKKYRNFKVILGYLPIIVAVSLGFVIVYNLIVPGANRVPFQTYLESPDALSEYLNRSESFSTNEGRYTDIGRGFALSYGWNSIRKDTLTLLFGYGLGARSVSRTLDTAGIGLTTGGLGFSVGTSLLILMQETGIVGLLSLGGLFIWILTKLSADIQKEPSSDNTSLRLGLLFCTILWPIWLWYANVWTMRVPMLLYWYLLGYVFSESHQLADKIQKKVTLKLALYNQSNAKR